MTRTSRVIGIGVAGVAISLAAILIAAWLVTTNDKTREGLAQLTPRSAWAYFYDDFSQPGTLEETDDPSSSASLFWWVNSGAQLIVETGLGRTIQGELPDDAYWRQRYSESNPTSTDDGYHPQNILRLIHRMEWRNFRQQAYFRVTAVNLSASETRNESNGLLLLSRYQDQDNLYYTGLRVDGAAVIKRKLNGAYTTLAYEPVFEGEYDRDTNPNMLPTNQWIGIRSEVKDAAGGNVELSLYLDLDNSGNWEPVLAVVDSEFASASAVPWDAGYAGIRTDFMDVEFDNFAAECLAACR